MEHTLETFVAHKSGEVVAMPEEDGDVIHAPPISANAYQTLALETAVYPGRGGMLGLTYAALGLAGEAGELAGQVSKCLRDDSVQLVPSRREKLLDEAGDVAWMLAAVCGELGTTLGDVMQANLSKLRMRAARGTIQGDKREEPA